MKESRYAIVTGASNGLGAAFAHELASRNYNLILISLPDDGLPGVARALEAKYEVDTVVYEKDLTETEHISEIGDEINQKYEIDILVNNAGIGGGRYFDQVNSTYLNQLILLNVRAPVLLLHKILPSLKKSSSSYVLNVASMAAMSPIPYKTVYPPSKAFLYNFTRSLGKEFEDTNIHFSVVNPGPMKTNRDVCERIESQSKFVQKSIIPVERVARVCIEKMLRKKSVITLDNYHKFQMLLLKFFPEGLKINILGKIARHEVQSNRQYERVRNRG